MGGWKTWAAAISSIAWGVGGFVAGLHDADAAMAFISGGLGMVGIGHKVEKLGGVFNPGTIPQSPNPYAPGGTMKMLPILVLSCSLVALSACALPEKSVVAKIRSELRTVVISGCAGKEDIEVSVDAVKKALPPGAVTEVEGTLALAGAGADTICAVAEAVQKAKAQPAAAQPVEP